MLSQGKKEKTEKVSSTEEKELFVIHFGSGNVFTPSHGGV